MKRFLYSVFFIQLITTVSWSLTLEMRTNGLTGALYTGEGVNGFTNTVLNLLDGSPDSAARIYTGSSIEIPLTKGYPVDRIKIYDGVGTDEDAYETNPRAKEVRIIGILSNESGTVTNYDAMSLLEDVPGGQTVELNNTVQADIWKIRIVSTYMPENSSDRTCYLSGIDLYYSGTKYTVGNLEEAKTAYRSEYRDRALKTVQMMFSSVRKVVFRESGEGLYSRWTNLGLPVGEMHRFYEKGDVCLYLEWEFTDKQPWGGKIFTAGKNGKMRKESKSQTGLVYEMHLDRKDLVLGEWKLDENGVMWIRIGKGTWKKTAGPGMPGSELGSVKIVSSI